MACTTDRTKGRRHEKAHQSTRKLGLAALSLCIAAIATTAEAQGIADSFEHLRLLVPGDTVSVTDTAGREVTGTIAVLSSSSLAMLVNGTQQQQQRSIAVGARVRVSTAIAGKTSRHIGRVTGLTSDTLVIVDERNPSTSLRLPLSEVLSLEVSGGVARRRLRGFAIGATIGGIAGVLLASPVLSESGCPPDCATPAGKALMGGIGVGVGGLVGAVVSPKTEQWHPIHVSEGTARPAALFPTGAMLGSR